MADRCNFTARFLGSAERIGKLMSGWKNRVEQGGDGHAVLELTYPSTGREAGRPRDRGKCPA